MITLKLSPEGSVFEGVQAGQERIGPQSPELIDFIEVEQGGMNLTVALNVFLGRIKMTLANLPTDESGWKKQGALAMREETGTVRVSTPDGVFCRPTSIPLGTAELVRALRSGEVRRDQFMELVSVLGIAKATPLHR